MANQHLVHETKYLVTIDVKSLYTNIPHSEGIESCLHFINLFRPELPKFIPNNRILKTLFQFVLENNYFLFQDTLYRQKFGTAMGSRMAPAYANLFLGKFEDENILIYPYLTKILQYNRFLDDIFLLWKGNLNELTEFQQYINQIHPTIKFTIEHSNKSINFLDTTIYIDRKVRKFKSKVFTKPTNAKPLLHYTSYHSIHTKENIIYTQALRYRLLTTDNKTFKNELKDLTKTLKRRGYPLQMIRRNFKKTAHLTQSDCLHNKIKKVNCNKNYKLNLSPKHRLPFIIEYYENLRQIKHILNRHWHLIQKDPVLHNIFPKKPYIVYKRHKNIAQKLVRARFLE